LLALTLVAWGAFPGFAWVGYTRSGETGIQAALVAVLACWSGAGLALLLTGIAAGGPRAVSATLLGMALRLGGPLVIGVVLERQGGPLAKSGVFGMILAYYFLTLIVETLLAVRLQPPRRCTNELNQLR
jgi:hypothetical protein